MDHIWAATAGVRAGLGHGDALHLCQERKNPTGMGRAGLGKEPCGASWLLNWALF